MPRPEKLAAPVAKYFISHADAAIKHQLLDILAAHIERVIQLQGIRDALGGEAMTLVANAHPLKLMQARATLVKHLLGLQTVQSRSQSHK